MRNADFLYIVKSIDFIFEMSYNDYATLFLNFWRNVTLTIE